MSDPYRTAADAGYPRWEYEVRGERSQTTIANDRDVLNAMGAKGWELVSACVTGKQTIFYFKRLKR